MKSPKDLAAAEAKSLVEQGYNSIAQTYLSWSQRKPSPGMAYTQHLLAALPPASKVLELGCGAGIPGTQTLLQSGHSVTANDISSAQIVLAQQKLRPENRVEFIKGDMMTLSFDGEVFDAAMALYSIFHAPRDEQLVLLSRIHGWLKPSGILLLNFATIDAPTLVDEDWLGAKMYWSSFDAETNLQNLCQAGFEIVKQEIITEDEDGRLIPFLWILASKQCQDE